MLQQWQPNCASERKDKLVQNQVNQQTLARWNASLLADYGNMSVKLLRFKRGGEGGHMEDTHIRALRQTFTSHPKTQIETPLCPFDTIYCTEMDIKNKILYILLVVLEMLLT